MNSHALGWRRSALVALLLASPLAFLGYSGGITGRTQKNGSGCTCHAESPTTSVNVVISGPDTLAPGQSATYKLTVEGGPLSAAGTNIAASSGTLGVITNEGLQKIGDELTHVSPKTPAAGSVSFQFTFRAPEAAGTATLYANGNSVNLSGSNTGDQWNFSTNKLVTVSGVTGIDDDPLPPAYALDQNYPNPFNPSTTIGYTLPATAHVNLTVYDETGREIAALVDAVQDAGRKSVVWEAGTIPTGVYYYRLTAGSFVETKRLVLLR